MNRPNTQQEIMQGRWHLYLFTEGQWCATYGPSNFLPHSAFKAHFNDLKDAMEYLHGMLHEWSTSFSLFVTSPDSEDENKWADGKVPDVTDLDITLCPVPNRPPAKDVGPPLPLETIESMDGLLVDAIKTICGVNDGDARDGLASFYGE